MSVVRGVGVDGAWGWGWGCTEVLEKVSVLVGVVEGVGVGVGENWVDNSGT